MRATILASILGVLGFTTYSMPRSTHEVIFERKEVPVVVKEYIIVTYKVPLIIEVPRYHSEEPIIVRPRVRGKAPVDWDRMMMEGVKYFEGYKSKKYYCCAGVATIGYGCTKPDIVNKGSLSKSNALRILSNEITNVRARVRQAVTVDLTGNQLNALTSFAFNCGMTNLNNLISGPSRLNSGNYKSIEKLLPKYRMAGGKVREGLEKRRAWELSLWRGETNLTH